MRSRVLSAAALALLACGVALDGCALPGRPMTMDRIPQPGRAVRPLDAPFDETLAATLAALGERSVTVENVMVRDYELGFFVVPDVVPGGPPGDEPPADSLRRCLAFVRHDADTMGKEFRPEAVLFGKDAQGHAATVTVRTEGQGSLVTAHLGTFAKSDSTALLDDVAARVGSVVTAPAAGRATL